MKWAHSAWQPRQRQVLIVATGNGRVSGRAASGFSLCQKGRAA